MRKLVARVLDYSIIIQIMDNGSANDNTAHRNQVCAGTGSGLLPCIELGVLPSVSSTEF